MLLLASVLSSFAVAQGPPLPEEYPLWPTVVELTSRLSRADAGSAPPIERELIGLGPSAIGPLLGVCSRKLPQCPGAERVLWQFGEVLVDEAIKLSRNSGSTFEVGCRSSALMGPAILEKLRSLIMRDESYEQHSQKFGICVLRKMGSEGVPTLIELARSESPRVRAVALSTLTTIVDPRAAPLFLEALRSPEEGIRRFGAAGLSRQPNPQAIPDLLRMVDEKSTIADYQETAMYALRGVYAPDLRLPIARHAWTNRVRSMRRAAAVTLSATNDRVAIRLGARYAPRRYVPSLPYYEWGPRLSFGICCLCFCVIFGVRVSPWIGAFLSGLVGVYWGYFAQDLWIYSEAFLIAVFAPCALAALWLWGARWRYLVIALVWFLCQWLLPLTLSAPLVLYGDGVMKLVQYEGLVLAIPALVLAGLLRERDPERLTVARRVGSRAAAAFYAGYGVSFAALWGYLGF